MSVTGVEGEERNDYSREESKQIRARSLRLLRSLLRPLRARVALTLFVVVVSTAGQVAGPALIAFGINQGLPAALKGDLLPLGIGVVAYLATGIVGAVLIAWYTMLSARVSQEVLFDLRRRVFLHAQRLSLEFHESYTSGRIIARQTSDLESIRELLDSGLNGLVRGVLYMTFVAIALVAFDPVSGLVVAGALIPLAFLTRWFQKRSQQGFRLTRTVSARVIVQVRRDDDRHPCGQGVPHREPQRHRVRGSRRGLPGCQRQGHQAVRLLRPGAHPDRQHRRRRRAARRRLPRHRRRPRDRVAARRAALHPSLLRPDGGDGDVLQLLPVGRGGAREDLGRARRGAERSRSGRPRRPVVGEGCDRVSTMCGSRITTTASCCPSSRSTFPPVRRSPSSARPEPASRPSPNFSPGSTTRAPARSN